MSTPLPRSTPEEQGVASAAILALVDRLEAEGLDPHGLTLVRHGQVVAEGWWAPYHRDGIRLLYSLSKSFASTAVGLAVAEGRLRLDEPLAEIFPEAAADAGPRARALTVHDALSMSTGHREDSLLAMIASTPDPERGFFGYEPEEPLGWFVYDNGATFMCGDAVQARTGERLVDYLRPRLFEPLGAGPAAWQRWGDRDLGFTGLFLSTEAIARFGLLVLADGVWEGRPLLPAGWFARATSALTDNANRETGVDWTQGYGYQFWRCRHGAYRGDGAYGQFCVVFPDQDAVLVLTGATERMQDVLDAVWEEMLPGFGTHPLPADAAAQRALAERLAAAQLPPVEAAGTPASPGPWTFRREPTPELPDVVELIVAADGTSLEVREGEVRHRAPLRAGGWPEVDGPFVASGGWTDPATVTAELVAVTSPHRLRLVGDTRTGTFEARWNVLPLRSPTLTDLIPPA